MAGRRNTGFKLLEYFLISTCIFDFKLIEKSVLLTLNTLKKYNNNDNDS